MNMDKIITLIFMTQKNDNIRISLTNIIHNRSDMHTYLLIGQPAETPNNTGLVMAYLETCPFNLN